MLTNLSRTPSPNKATMVPPGGLQEALNRARCGDVLELRAGEAYDGSQVTWPAHRCDDGQWITVRTSSPDSQLPPEGTRISPCWSGVSSLPTRPTFPCPKGSPQVLTARIFVRPDSTMRIAGDHYRLIGLEITRPAGGVTGVLATTFGGSQIIFDRCWIHGTATDETKVGIVVSDSHDIAIIDSYLSDFHCIARTGACTDAQAIAGGFDHAAGNSHVYKIVGNFLEASGESFLFGGSYSVDTPADIEIRENHLFKPMNWYPASPNYVGVAFIVKNNGELKNAQRVLLEGNVFENVWGGFSQEGYQMLITPKNQGGRRFPISSVTRSGGLATVTLFAGSPYLQTSIQVNIVGVADSSFDGFYTMTDLNSNTFTYPQPGLPDASSKGGRAAVSLCPICEVTDITVLYCYFSGSPSGIQMGVAADDNGGVPKDGGHWSLHDLIFDAMDARLENLSHTGRGSVLFLIGTGLQGHPPVLHDVAINHITGLEDSSDNSTRFMLIGGPADQPMRNFTFANSIFFAAQYPVLGIGGGGNDCASTRIPAAIFKNCFSPPATFTHNAIIGASDHISPSSWPQGNFFVTNLGQVRFVNYDHGEGRDYRLCRGRAEPSPRCTDPSPFADKASDGTDLGANVGLVMRHIARAVPEGFSPPTMASPTGTNAGQGVRRLAWFACEEFLKPCQSGWRFVHRRSSTDD